MLLWLFEQLAGYHSSFQVVRYLTLRSLLSVLTALTIGLVLGPVMIRKLQALKYGQAVSAKKASPASASRESVKIRLISVFGA